jgi:hypothetical protein
MKDALFWIEWLDRLERTVDGARHDATTLARAWSSRGSAQLASSGRQLSFLLNELQGLDASTVASLPGELVPMRVNAIVQLLEAATLQIPRAIELGDAASSANRTKILASIDGLLRDCRYEMRMLIRGNSGMDPGMPAKRPVAQGASLSS